MRKAIISFFLLSIGMVVVLKKKKQYENDPITKQNEL